MGLDTVAAYSPDNVELTEDDLQAFNDAGIPQIGIISAKEIGIFRGKVFEEVVRRITGVSLYQEWIPPETVREMYQSIKAYEFSKWQEDNENVYPEEVEHSDLCKFFNVCAERELGLVAWS
ncbi:hypothetical protein KQH56_02715 [bacterium]|nr:hypothetical protein [bacterium]